MANYRYSDTPPILRRYSDTPKPILSRYSADAPPILRRHSADTPPILRRCSADTPPILRRYSDTLIGRAAYTAATRQIPPLCPKHFFLTGGLLALKGRHLRPALRAPGQPTRLRQTFVQPQPALHIPNSFYYNVLCAVLALFPPENVLNRFDAEC